MGLNVFVGLLFVCSGEVADLEDGKSCFFVDGSLFIIIMFNGGQAGRCPGGGGDTT